MRCAAVVRKGVVGLMIYLAPQASPSVSPQAYNAPHHTITPCIWLDLLVYLANFRVPCFYCDGQWGSQACRTPSLSSTRGVEGGRRSRPVELSVAARWLIIRKANYSQLAPGSSERHPRNAETYEPYSKKEGNTS